MNRGKLPVLVRLLAFLLVYKRRFLLALVCVLASSAFVLLTPYLIGWGVDKAIGGGSGRTRDLIIVSGAIVGVSLLRGVFQYGQAYLGEWLSQRVAYDMRNAIYDRLQRLSYAYHDQAQTGQIMSRATQDVEGVRMLYSLGLLRLIYVLILLIVVFVLMVVRSWHLALAAWAFVPVVAAISTYMTLKLRPVWMQVQDMMGRLSTVIQENLSGMRVVKAFSREEYENQKFEVEARSLFDFSYSTNRWQASVSPFMTGLWMMTYLVAGWIGAREIDAGTLSVGDLTQFVLYLTILQLPVRSLGWIVMWFSRAQSSGERIYEILDAESAVKEKPDAIEMRDVRGDVRFENVSFGYDAISPVLRDVEIDARPGQVVALLGPTGSGKTTVVNLMPRFYDVTGGRITIDGIDIRDVTLASLRRNIGIVQQDLFLFSATLRDNIAYGAVDASDDDVVQAARAARIHDFIQELPDGYDTWVGERGVTLSGGQKQRIAIARTLLMNPPILVFDDSTSSVDTETEYLIQQALAELMKGRTTFVIAQRLRTVKAADQILVLKDGRIVERGRHEELIASDGLYRSIYDLELRDQEEAFERAQAAALQAQAFPAG